MCVCFQEISWIQGRTLRSYVGLSLKGIEIAGSLNSYAKHSVNPPFVPYPDFSK